MKKIIKTLIREALEKAREAGELQLSSLPDIVVEEPRDKKMGDFSTTVAMSLAKPERKNPRAIAASLCRHLGANEGGIESVETAGPGFINLKMSPAFYLARLPGVAEQGERFGDSDIGNREKVLLEFVSANPTGPLHVGHGRGAAVGATLGAILKKSGFDVDTEYYINDVGNQMNVLGKSAWLRYKEHHEVPVKFPKDHYQGDYIRDIAREIVKKHGDEFLSLPDEKVLPFFKQYAAEAILDVIKKDLREFRVEYDTWFSERSLFEDNSVDRGIEWMREKGYVYEKDGAVWLKSSAFRDEKDRVIVKESGEKTYFCSDIAYHQNKINRGYQKIINIWGADHHGYVARMQAVVEAMGFDLEKFQILLVQFVTLKRGGEKVSMSTRSGEFVTLKEVVREVGVDAARFFFLMRGSDSHLDFDMELAKKETPENPVFYIQYAHARICSIFQTAAVRGIALGPVSGIDVSLLREAEERDLIKKILSYPEVVEKSALVLEVHLIPHYLHDLVALFHSYYSKHRVVTDDQALTQARLLLVHGLRVVIRSGLGLLGVSAPEKM